MATIQEIVHDNPGVGSLSAELLRKIIIDRGLNPSDDYDASMALAVNLSTADALVKALSLPDYTENKQSEKLPRKYMFAEAIRLYRANGEPEKASGLLKSNVKLTGKAPKRW